MSLPVMATGLLLHAATSKVKGRLRFETGQGAAGIPGWALIAYAVVLYPLVGLLAGQPLDELPAFGLRPCPLTLTTLGCLLFTAPPTPRALWPIPILWSLVGGSAAGLLAMTQDWPLPVGGVIAAVLLIAREHSLHGKAPPGEPRRALEPCPAKKTPIAPAQ